MLGNFGHGKSRGRLDISEEEVLTKWLAQSFQIGCEAVVQESSGPFPRLDRWLAAEFIKGLKQLPELQFKVQGYIEGCARDAIAPRGRAILHMISVTLSWIVAGEPA